MEGLVDVSAALVSLPSMTSPSCLTTFGCLPYFFGGILLLALVECTCAIFFIRRLLQTKPAQNSSPSSSEYRGEGGSNNSSFNLQGFLWVASLPEGDLSKAILLMPGKEKKREKEAEKDGPKEGSNRVGTTKNVLRIAPVRKHAVLREGILSLEVDGNVEQISLEGCEVSSVSHDQTSNGKWSKMFPIKLHHPTRTLYGDCKDCLFYAESGFEKETWCEVLRATAQENPTSDEWYVKLKKEFREYTDVVKKRVPHLDEFPSGIETNSMAAIRKETKSDDFKNSEESLSKRRLIFNKILRRGAKTKEKSSNATRESETSTRGINSISEGQEGSQKFKESVISIDHDTGSSASYASQASIENITRSESTLSECNLEQSTSATTQGDKKEVDQVLATTLVHGHDNKIVPKEIDQGQLCLNMLVARLFFDLYHSNRPVDWLQHQLQRLLSRMKTPSYVKSLAVKEIDLGKEPPFATALRLLPADAEGGFSIEVSLEWRSGGFITFETRVDVRDQNAQEKMASQLPDSGFEGASASAVVRDIEKDLDSTGSAEASKTSVETRQAAATNKRGPGDDSSKGGGWMHSVKAVISRVADQVSQVPLVLKIRLMSVKGTCIVSLKAPPSDRIWISFKDMPDFDLVPEPCIGDHFINNDLLGNFIANHIKAQICEHIVMPYRQDIRLHWMLADQVEWLPRSAIPVAFSAAKHSENERQSSKSKFDEEPKPVEDNAGIGESSTASSRSVHSNGQDELKVEQISEASKLLHVGSVDGSLIMQAQPPPDPRSLGNLQTSGTSRNQFQNSAISVQFSSEHSLPSRPPGSSVHSSATSSIRVDKESDLRKPLLHKEDQIKGKISASSSEFDTIESERAVGAVFIDVAPQSDDSASDSESQHPPNQFQFINQDHAKADLSKDLDSRVSRRTKMFTLGKKVGNKLDERRRSVLEKLREKRAEGSEAGSPRHSYRDLV